MTLAKRRVYGWGFGIFLLLFWQILSVLIARPFLLPSPIRVLSSIWEARVELFTVHAPATLQVVALGGLFSVLLGVVLATAMDWFPLLEKAVYPLLTVTQTIPVMCLAPVFVLWFGYSLKMRVIVVVLVNFFTVTVNLADGYRATDTRKQELLTTFGASKLQIFLLLRLPTALPWFFTALRIALPWAVVGAAVAEWLGAPVGLGTYSRTCMMSLNAAGLLAPLVVLTVAALALNALLTRLEKAVLARFGDF